MQTKTLFSSHYLDKRLPEHAEWAEEARPALEALRPLWARASEHGPSWNEAQTEAEFVRPVLEALGWSYIVQAQSKRAGQLARPDYALFADAAARDEGYALQGSDDAFYGRALAIGEAKYWGRRLSQKDASGRDSWQAASNPSHQMVSYLVGTRVAWGILTNGRVWRLYSREVSSTASQFYEVDLGPLFDSLPQTDLVGADLASALAAFKRWWLFFRRASFVPDARGRSFVERVQEGSGAYARQISDKLKELVYQEVMPEIAGGFVAYRHHQLGVGQETEESLRQVYQASLSLLYKLLFLLYAEARGLLPMDNPSYREGSLTATAQWAADRLDRRLPLSDATYATSRYDTLLALFHRVDRGDPDLGVPRYDGGLFNPANPDNRFLEAHKLSDRAVARAVDILVRDAGEPVDYAYIGVRNLGAIYEGLLENKLRVVDAAAGRVELVDDKGERKASGSYYTPDYIVAYIAEKALAPVLDGREAEFATAMERCAGLRRELRRRAAERLDVNRRLHEELEAAERDAREAFLGIKALDPAMGSGHFLVNAVDYLTDQVIRRMQAYHDAHPEVPWEWNPIQRLIEAIRADILAELERQGIAVDPERLDDTALLTRLIMKRCIYGVDLNPMAVELAKLSLWLHSFTLGAPLSFLDHHLRWGNSLIGADVQSVEREMRGAEQGGALQLGLFAGPFAGLLDLTGLMIEVAERADATLADVRHSAETFERFQADLIPYKRVLDLWVSQYFGNAQARQFLTLHGPEVLGALKGETPVREEDRAAIERARALWREKRFFHWDLEFPEVFVDLRGRDWADNPGFDVVIGNPPYVFIISIAQDDRDFYFTKYGTCDYRFDLYGLFVHLGIDLCSLSGCMGYILPHSLLNNNSFEKLRLKIIEESRTVEVIDFTDRVFPDAANEPMVLLLSKKHHVDEQTSLKGTLIPSKEIANAQRYLSAFSASAIHSLPGRPFLVRGGEWIRSLLTNDNCRSMSEYVLVTQGLRTGDNARFLSGLKGPMSRKVLAGADIHRYGCEWSGQYVLYDREGLDAPRDEVFWKAQERIIVQEIRNVHLKRRIIACLDDIGYIGLNTTNVIISRPNSKVSLKYVMAILSSRLINEYFRACFVDNHIATQYILSVPVHHIIFDTSADDRQHYAEDGQRLYKQFSTQEKGGVALLSFVDDHLSAGRSDVVHDLLAHLAGQMMDMHKEKQAVLHKFRLDLSGYLDEKSLRKLNRLYTPKQTPGEGVKNYEQRLAAYQEAVAEAEARLGALAGETLDLEDFWRLDQGQWVWLLRQNLRRVEAMSDLVGVYRAYHARLAPLMVRIERTDGLIDQVVYRLYGLTEAEVAVVEGRK